MDTSHDSRKPMMCAFIEMQMGLLGRITGQTPWAPDLGGGWWGRHGELRLHISGILSSDLPRGVLLWLGGLLPKKEQSLALGSEIKLGVKYCSFPAWRGGRKSMSLVESQGKGGTDPHLRGQGPHRYISTDTGAHPPFHLTVGRA